MNIKEYISSGIIEAYVLGLATQEEVSILECVRKNNIEVEQAILDAQQTLEDFSTLQAVSPPKDLKESIWNKITQQSEEEIEAPKKHTEIKAISEAKNNFDWKKLAVAASVLFIMTFGTTLYYHNKNKNTEVAINHITIEKEKTSQSLANMEARWSLLQNPAINTITLAGVEKYPDLVAHVFWNATTAEVYLSSENLPQAPENMQYQLWAIVDGVPVDAGVFDLKDDQAITKMLKIEKAQAFAITLEKMGGNPTPTLSQLYVMGNI